MKYILLILLISFAIGQPVSAPTIGHERPDEEMSESASITAQQIMIHKEMVKYEQPITLFHLLEYAEECYNDSNYVGERHILGESFYSDGTISTQSIQEFRFDDDTYWGVRYNTPIRIEEIYEPGKPTFPGFIEWYLERIK